MCKSLEYFKANRPEVDARTDEIAETGRRAETSAGKTTAEQVKADLEYHKRMKTAPFSLATSFSKTALRTADREPMGGFLWGLLFSVRCHSVENSPEHPDFFIFPRRQMNMILHFPP